MSAIENAEDELFEFLVIIVLLAILAIGLWLYLKAKNFDPSALFKQFMEMMKNLLHNAVAKGESLPSLKSFSSTSGDYESDTGVSASNQGDGPYQVVTGISSSMAAAMQQDANFDPLSEDQYAED